MSVIPAAPAASGPPLLLPGLPGWRREALSRALVVIVGCGAIGSLLAESLLALGIRRFVLVDPKKYGESSTANQCGPADAGRHKVAVVAGRLRREGASVAALARHVEALEPGWIAGADLVVAAADRRSAELRSHRVAMFLRRPFAKVNLEVPYLAVAVRYLDYRRPVSRCLECAWTWPEDYSRLADPRSCDGGREERSTRSPRPLGALAARWSAWLLAATIAADGAAERFHGKEILLNALAPGLVESDLPEHAECASGHAAAGGVVRLEEGPRVLSFEALARRAELAGAGPLWASGSGAFLTRGACAGCGAVVGGLWWAARPERPVGRCSCGGLLRQVPFSKRSRLERSEIGAAWSSPLARLGFGPKALVTLSSREREASFVLS
jgi:hypothetical protein